MPEWIKQALPHLSPEEQAERITRPTFIAENPEELDYLDVLNPVIGIAYHAWCGRSPEDYPHAPIIIDGFFCRHIVF